MHTIAALIRKTPKRIVQTSARGLLCLCTALVLIVGMARESAGQNAPSSGPQRATRAELAAKLSELERQLSTNPKKDVRARLIDDVAALRERLETGDFRVGDRFYYVITQDSVRGDTALVRDGLSVTIGNLPDFSIRGVLRSELTERLSVHLEKYLRRATVRTTALTRVQVTGAVARPGFYVIVPDRPLSEILMIAGGPAIDAKIEELEIRRGEKVVLSASDSRRAIKDGRTAEEVDLQSGDAITIPVKRKLNWTAVLQAFSIISVVFFSVIQFVQWYYNRQQQ